MQMSDDPKPNLPPDPQGQKLSSFWFRFLFWVKRPSTIAIMFSLVALGTGATVWAYLFITQNLAPLVSAQITKIVNRPVELGKVEGFSLNSIRFSRSVMPPTKNDPDRLSIEGVKVGFNIVPLLLKRSLPITITLEQVNVYIEQDESGAWLDLNITTEDKPLPIEIPTTIKINDAQIVLLAKDKTTPLSVNLDLKTQLSEKFKQAKYDVALGIKTGQVKVKGETFLGTGESKVNARIDNFALTDLNPIIPDLPINLTNGFVAANLDVTLPSFEELPTVLGTLGFRDIEVAGDILPEKLLANGLLRFQGQTINLEEVQGSLGAIAAEVSGQVDLNQGFNVAVDVNPFSLNSLLELAQVESPIFLDGDMAVNLQVTGPLKNPQVAGKVEAIRNTRIDQVDFEEISLNFLADLQQFTLTELRILPVAGGQITGEGEVKFPSKSPQDIQLAFDFGADLPINAIASPYNLPPELAIGSMKAAAKIRGTADNPEASLNWRLPAAEITVPNPNNPLAIALSGVGEIIFRDKIVRLRNTFLKLGDGSITLAGNGNLETKKWQFSMAAASFTLDPFLPVPMKLAIANANTKASGSLDNLDPKAIAAAGELGLNIEGGTIQGEGQLDRGNISASAAISQIELNRFTNQFANNQFNPPIPLTLLAGDLKLSGSLDNLDPGAIKASANLGLKVADGLINIKGEINSGFVKAGVTNSAINLARIAPQLPIPITLLGSQVNLSASIASLINAAISAKSTNEGLPTGLNLNGIDFNTDIRLKVADGLVNAQAQVNSGKVNAALNTTEIDVLSLLQKPGFSKKPGFLEKPGFLGLLADVKLLGIQANLSSSLAALINGANTAKNAIARQELPPADSLTGIDINTDIRLRVAEGLINTQAQLNSNGLKVLGNGSQINLNRLGLNLPIPVAIAGGEFNLATSLPSLLSLPKTQDFRSLNANVNLDLLVADGRINAAGRLNAGSLFATANSSEKIYLDKLSPNLPIPITLLASEVTISAEVNRLIAAAQKVAIAGIDALTPETLRGVQVNGNVDLAIAQGRVNAIATVKGNQWQTAINTVNVQLLEFTAFLPPTILENQFLELNPNKFQLNSQANLAGKIAPLFAFGAEPVAIQLNNVSAQLGDQSLQAKGSIVLTDLITNPDVSQLQLDLMVRSNLNTLPVKLPPQAIAQGKISFDGRLEGRNLISDPLSPGNLQFISDLRLENVAVNDFQLDPILAGDLKLQTGKAVAIALKGKRDSLSAEFAACNQSECLLPYLPVALAVKLGLDAENPLIINGKREGDRFNLNLEEFSLAALKIAPAIDYGIAGTIGGKISANLGINLFTLGSSGNLRITKPSVGYIQGEEFATNFAYIDGIAQIPQGYLKLGQSQYQFQGGINLNTTEINGKITTQTAQVEDILNTFSWYRVTDLIRNVKSPNTDSANLQTASRGMPDESLMNQLLRFAEIHAILQRNAEVAKLASPPNLIDIRGGYQADVLIAGTVKNPQVDLKVAAQNLEWRTKPPVVEVGETGVNIQDNKIIPIDRVIVQANFRDGFFTVQPMRVEFGDTLISFVGKLGLESTTGKFQMEKLSLDTLRNFVEIPGVKIDGNINANAVLAGTINNPQIRGDISLTEGEINDQAVDRVFGSFSLSNQRLLFATTQPSSLQVFGSVPVPPVPGQNDLVSLNLNIGTEAIALLNLFTQKQLEWISGEGEIKLSAKGKLDLENRTLKQLEATGAMTFQNAVLKTATLDEALTINGQIAFDQERIRIDQFAGTFANSILTAQGVLPILEPLSPDDPDLEYPMTISLNEGKINLENIYKGKVGGEVTIAGAAFRPIIGGEIRLEHGKASVPKRDETTSAAFTLEEKEPPIVPILDNFRIILGNKFELKNWPLFDFRITGDLTVNGSLYDLKPDGIIQLVRGQINLFSSQFFVTRNYEQIVEFSPDWGLDPNLNIQLGTIVLEKSSEQRLPDSESEIADPLVFSARPDQIDVQLTIKGRSSELLAAMDSNSQLLDLVELTSIPNRNKSEIIALLGNKFLTTLEEIQRLPGDLSNRSSREWLELAINNFIVKPYVQELQFTLEDMVTKTGRKIGLEDLRVYPTIEGIYQINEESVLGISYDYNYQQFEVEYKIRF
jgi:hypothetical protein